MRRGLGRLQLSRGLCEFSFRLDQRLLFGFSGRGVGDQSSLIRLGSRNSLIVLLTRDVFFSHQALIPDEVGSALR